MADGEKRGPGPSTGDKRKAGPSTQKHKHYRYQGNPRGGRGRGGRGRAGGGGGDRQGQRGEEGQGEREGEREAPRKRSSMGRYRTVPLPEMLTSPGISVTTWRDRERPAEAELIDYLEQIADELYPETIEDQVKDEPEGDADMDFEALLKKDLESMKAENKSNRFQLCSHPVMCVIYINVLPPLSPHVLVRRILEQAESTAKSPLKYCKRLIPISATGGATLRQLADAAGPVVEEAFKTDDGRALKFAIDTNTRQSDKLQRMEMITTVAEQVTKLDKGHSVDLKNPDKTILVELYKNSVGITVVDDYERFKKYNPSSIASHAAQSQGRGQASTSSRVTQPAISGSSVPAPVDDGLDGKGDANASTDLQDGASANTSTVTPKHVYRERRAEGIAGLTSTSTGLDANQAGAGAGAGAEKAETEEGEVESSAEARAEVGEVLENPTGELRDGWVEEIDGDVVRVREGEGKVDGGE